MIIKVCHITSVHSSKDGRIFYKQCRSLSKAGYDVYLVAPDTNDRLEDGVKIFGITPKKNNRLYRIFTFTNLLFKKAIEIDAHIYHLHDPELLPLAPKFLKRGKLVIFDSHEDVPLQIMNKYWIPRIFRIVTSGIYKFYERTVLKRVNAVISVTPNIVERLRKQNKNTFQVTNYPIIDELKAVDKKLSKTICFAGSIDELWMHENIIKAVNRIDDVFYEVAGPGIESYIKSLKEMDPNRRTVFRGQIPHTEVLDFIRSSFAGMALYNYCPELGDKVGTLGNTKFFEYMMAGVPVICTDFILWEKIVKDEKAGICVNPSDIDGISEAISYLYKNPEIAFEMGKNGQKAVKERYNWDTQVPILLEVYNVVSGNLSKNNY